MPSTSGASLLRTIRLVYGAILLAATACALGAYYFWPGIAAWIFLALGALILAGGMALAQLLARFRMILWLLPHLERWRTRNAGRSRRADERTGSDPNGR